MEKWSLQHYSLISKYKLIYQICCFFIKLETYLTSRFIVHPIYKENVEENLE